MNLAGFGEKYAGIRKNIYGCCCFPPVLLLSSGVTAKRDTPCPPAPRLTVRSAGHGVIVCVPLYPGGINSFRKADVFVPRSRQLRPAGRRILYRGTVYFALGGGGGKCCMVGSVIQHRGGHGEKRRKTLHGAEEEAGESIIKHRGGHGGRQGKVL